MPLIIKLHSSPEASISWSILNGMILARNNAEVISNETIPSANKVVLVDMMFTPMIIQVINPTIKLAMTLRYLPIQQSLSIPTSSINNDELNSNTGIGPKRLINIILAALIYKEKAISQIRTNRAFLDLTYCKRYLLAQH